MPHPIVSKALACFGSSADDDNYVGLIAASNTLPLLEIKQSQWRGGVWQDPKTGVCWLVVAGLAKGGHDDHDDFYRRVGRQEEFGDPTCWLPTSQDALLLKQETAARLRTEWELAIQKETLDALRSVHSGGAATFRLCHPVEKQLQVARVEIEVVQSRDEGIDTDEIFVEIIPDKRFAGSDLLWQLTSRVLIALNPPEQGWDRFRDTYSNIGEPGDWGRRISALDRLVSRNELAISQPGTTSHYAHRDHIAGCTIEGQALQALCGVYFVPTQDHEQLPPCPRCDEHFASLPG